MSKGTFTFMGSGTSRGVPMLCCDCEVCRSTDPRNKHTRSSGLVTIGKTRILIDCGPDLRAQLLRENVTRLDAVLLTHPHCDHLDGLDDLQGLTVHSREELPFYSSPANLKVVHQRFGYVDELKIAPNGTLRWSIPQLDYREVTEPFDINGITVIPLPLFHGRAPTYGYRIGSFAYVCDCSRIPDETYALLDGVTDVVLDALRWKEHPTHFNIIQAEREFKKIGAKRGWLTHLTHDILYERDQHNVAEGCTLAYDGLSFDFEV
ncbi:MAG: MBL fold metallo-hydrolase [Lentisphaeria bacterium]|nr:MBL fold metallo-hydrolase [Lentisphaeria bacterium]